MTLNLVSLAIGVLIASAIWITYIKTRKKPKLPEILEKLRKMNDALREADTQLFKISDEIQSLYKIFTKAEK